MRLPSGIPTDVLERLARRDADPVLRIRAAHELGDRFVKPADNPWHRDGLDGRDELTSWLLNGDMPFRLAAAWELGRRGEPLNLRDLLVRNREALLGTRREDA